MNDLKSAVPICRVLVVEDDLRLAEILRRQINAYAKGGRFAFEVTITPDVAKAVERAQNGDADIFVIDLGLKDPSRRGRISPLVGLRYLPKFTECNNSGVIVYSAEDKNMFFENTIDIGADDFIQKSDPSEFVVKKIVALWRRAIAVRADVIRYATGFHRVFQIGKWKFSVGSQTLEYDDGTEAHIGLTEHEFLKCMCLSAGMSLNENEIGAFVFKRVDFDNSDLRKSLENLLYRLRKKLKNDCITYVGGGQYKIVAAELK